MSQDPDVDVDELRGDIEQIKAAMGIQERYSGATSIWLFFGLAVPVASALSQYVHLEHLPTWYHWLVWLVVLGGGYAGYLLFSDESIRPSGDSAGTPNLFVQFGLVYFAAVPLQTIAFEYTADVGYVAKSAMALSIIVVMLGVAYGVLGSSMEAFHVRRRDRWLFYVGTLWMIALGMLIPGRPFLETWPYAVFGGLYFVYAIGAYAVMRTGGNGD